MAVSLNTALGAFPITALAGTSYVPLAGGTMTGALTIAGGTLAASAPALNITQTWNNGSVGFTAALIDITNSASTGSSYPLLIKLGGSNLFAFSKAGELVCNSIAANIDLAAFADTYIRRISAGVAGQYNGASAQAYQIYSLRTDGSNYERLTLTGVAGTSVNITAETLGTGADNLDIWITPVGTGKIRSASDIQVAYAFFAAVKSVSVGLDYVGYGVQLPSNGIVSWVDTTDIVSGTKDIGLYRNAAGVVEVNNGTAGTWRDLKLRNLLNTEYHQMTEMTAPSAPAANSVRIYAEDNGAGKTRLMALFATGSAVQLGIEP